MADHELLEQAQAICQEISEVASEADLEAFEREAGSLDYELLIREAQTEEIFSTQASNA